MTLAEFVKQMIVNGGQIGTDELAAGGANYAQLPNGVWGWIFSDGSMGYFTRNGEVRFLTL